MYESYFAADTITSSVLLGLGQVLTSSVFSIAIYVMTALSLYTIAQRRGLHKPWLAWIPVANVWLLGSISDQYRYVSLGQSKSKRKWLLGLKLASTVLSVVILVQAASIIGQAVMNLTNYADYDQFLGSILASAISMLAMLVPLLAVSIACKVLNYMALYDIFKSLDPANCVLFLVLSILFPITEPFFLIFNRNKDLGMPPRRPEPPVPNPPEFL